MRSQRPPRSHASRPAATLLLLAGALASTACGKKDEADPASAKAPAGPGYSVLLLTLDTTRPDALSCYGMSGPTTPSLDSLAADGIAFDRAFTPVPTTLPAHASLFTGLVPPRHGLRDNGHGALAPEATTLAELCREQGYETAAFVGSVVLDRTFGLDQGFDVYDAPRGRGARGEETPGKDAERPAREVVEAALAWFGKRDGSRPSLLWCHFFDPHTPYAPPPEVGESPMDSASSALPPEYVREVRGMDLEIGRLLVALEAQGALARTLVVAAGDHGESYGEHGEKGHGILCHDATLRVPLILRLPQDWPGERPAGQRSNAIVSLVDVFPTVARALGRTPGEVDGLDLLGSIPADRGIYFESYSGYLSYGWSPLAGWLDAAGKYVHGTEPAFYDWAADPGETVPLERTEVELEPYRRAIASVAAEPALPVGGAADEELLESLRGLGYVASGPGASKLPGPLEATGLPAPASMWTLHDEAVQALVLAQQGSVGDAELVFRRVLDLNPKNPFVLEQLATCLIQQGRLPDAADTLARILRETPGESPRVWFRLGTVLRGQGKVEQAIQALRRADDLAPNRALYLRELYSALRDAGKAEEASAVSKRLAALPKE
jgi:arylsulfatase A-like enzyme